VATFKPPRLSPAQRDLLQILPDAGEAHQAKTFGELRTADALVRMGLAKKSHPDGRAHWTWRTEAGVAALKATEGKGK
jgi:hypothetical protein